MRVPLARLVCTATPKDPFRERYRAAGACPELVPFSPWQHGSSLRVPAGGLGVFRFETGLTLALTLILTTAGAGCSSSEPASGSSASTKATGAARRAGSTPTSAGSIELLALEQVAGTCATIVRS